MTDLQVYKKIDKKVKLYKTGLFTQILTISAVCLLAGEGAASVFDLNPFISKIAYVLGTLGSMGVIFPLLSNNPISNKADLYTQIRKDLENGINDFENVKEEDFKKTLGSYHLPNRTK